MFTMRNKRIVVYVLAAIGVLVCCSIPVVALAGSRLLSVLFQASTSTPVFSGAVKTLSTPGPTPTPVTVCGGPPAMFILLVGTDSRADSYAAGLSDSMRIVRVDFVDPGLTHLAFQRDLYVEIPGIADHGITHGKLNQAYLYGNSSFGYYDEPGAGPGLLALTMNHNFGTQTDHYVAVNLQAFSRIIDSLGGIDINLPSAVDGRANANDHTRYFPAGQQHLDGYRTMLLARMRPEGDMQRSNIQNLILQAIAAKVLSPAVLPALPDLITTLQGSTQTDLGPAEIAQLLCLASMIAPDKIVAVNFPENLFVGTRVDDPVLGRTFVWDVDFDILRAYMEYFNRGSWPETPLQ
jgi:LCP family protein required for cell wall assembly